MPRSLGKSMGSKSMGSQNQWGQVELILLILPNSYLT